MGNFEDDLFQVYLTPGVVTGYCLIVKDRQVVYVGPLESRPTGVTPADIFISPDDFALVRAHLKGATH